MSKLKILAALTLITWMALFAHIQAFTIRFINSTVPIDGKKIYDDDCLRQTDILLRLINNGSVDANMLHSIASLNKIGTSVMAYMTPCVTCKNGKDHGNEMCELVKSYHCFSNEGYLAALNFIDVTNPSVWSTFPADNIAFIKEYMSVMEKCDCDDLHMFPGILTTKENWEVIMGNYTGQSDKDLWYVHLDGTPDANEFIPFGGWTAPIYKTYEKDYSICNSRDSPKAWHGTFVLPPKIGGK